MTHFGETRCKLASTLENPNEERWVTWTETFNCDICGKQKGSTDHWWLAWTEPYTPHPDAPERRMFKIYPWENMLAHDAEAKHLCGQACLQKLVDRWLNAEMGVGHGSASGGK
jgi:hypothetical protein